MKQEIKSCYLCRHIETEGGYEEGYYDVYCCERELENDKRFPYKRTKCKKYERRPEYMEIYKGYNKYVEKCLLKGEIPNIY